MPNELTKFIKPQKKKKKKKRNNQTLNGMQLRERESTFGLGDGTFLAQWVQINQQKKKKKLIDQNDVLGAKLVDKLVLMLAAEGGFVKLRDGAEGGDVGGEGCFCRAWRGWRVWGFGIESLGRVRVLDWEREWEW